MKLQYKIALFFLLLSQTSFLLIAAYHTDNELYYPNDQPNAEPTVGYSWIWYHLDHWIISLFLAFAGLITFSHGLISDYGEKKKKKSKPEEPYKSTNNTRKAIYIVLLIIIWILVILLSLYFAGLFN